MPLFPPVTDTLRWEELVRQGRAQLPLVAPDWTDQNTSDPGIALLELVSWLVEAGSYRSSAVSDRERLRLLALAGTSPEPARAARCLVRPTGAPGHVAAGTTFDGERDGARVPMTLVQDVMVTGAAIAAVAWAGPGADAAAYRSDCVDLTRERSAGRIFAPLGPDPHPGDALVLGVRGQSSGPVDVWLVVPGGVGAPEVAEPAEHHSAVTVWESWHGDGWTPMGAADDTAALTRSGRVRLELPMTTAAALGDQTDGVLAGRALTWIRCRLNSGRHDAPPALAAIHVDAGEAVASRPYESSTGPAPIGTATGVAGESMRLPQPWCDAAPMLSLGDIEPFESLTPVADLAHADPHTRAVALDPDGMTVRFGDGHWGRTLPEGATVRASGTWTTPAGVGEVRPPITVRTRPGDAYGFEVVAGLRPGAEAEDVADAAARAEASMWVHERLTDAVRAAAGLSLDDLELEAVRRLGVPERAVTALDFERIALATPGVSLARARALAQVDPRIPGLVADSCVTVVIVPWLPAGRPQPSRGALHRVRAQLEGGRTLGSRVFVVGPTYVSIGVAAMVIPRRGVSPRDAEESAAQGLRRFLHPVTGGSGGRGWPFGRAVRRTEILQVLDERSEIDRVVGLTLSREIAGRTSRPECGDVSLCPTELALAGTLSLVATSSGGRP